MSQSGRQPSALDDEKRNLLKLCAQARTSEERMILGTIAARAGLIVWSRDTDDWAWPNAT